MSLRSATLLGSFLLIAIGTSEVIVAGEQQPAGKLVVGNKEVVPFSMKNPDGFWSSLSIDLWKGIANELKLDSEFKEMDLKGLVDGLARGSIDVGVAALTVTGSTSEDYLQRRAILFRHFPAALDALMSLSRGEVDAVVYDGPILRYLALNKLQEPVRFLPTGFERQDDAIALKSNSPLREPINRILLRKIQEVSWELSLRSYLGGS